MESGKNIISNSIINTEGGDFINGDNNFIQKIFFNFAYNKAGLKSIVKQTKNVLNKIQSDISGHILKRNLTDLPFAKFLFIRSPFFPIRFGSSFFLFHSSFLPCFIILFGRSVLRRMLLIFGSFFRNI